MMILIWRNVSDVFGATIGAYAIGGAFVRIRILVFVWRRLILQAQDIMRLFNEILSVEHSPVNTAVEILLA